MLNIIHILLPSPSRSTKAVWRTFPLASPSPAPIVIATDPPRNGEFITSLSLEIPADRI